MQVAPLCASWEGKWLRLVKPLFNATDRAGNTTGAASAPHTSGAAPRPRLRPTPPWTTLSGVCSRGERFTHGPSDEKSLDSIDAGTRRDSQRAIHTASLRGDPGHP